MLRERTERNLASAGAALGDESLQRALQDGARLSLQEAVAYAQRGRGEHADATHGWASLSPVERQVVERASQGLSNPDIARDLFISRNTVKVYLSRAYAKLGVANRTELALLATRHFAGPPTTLKSHTHLGDLPQPSHPYRLQTSVSLNIRPRHRTRHDAGMEAQAHHGPA